MSEDHYVPTSFMCADCGHVTPWAQRTTTWYMRSVDGVHFRTQLDVCNQCTDAASRPLVNRVPSMDAVMVCAALRHQMTLGTRYIHHVVTQAGGNAGAGIEEAVNLNLAIRYAYAMPTDSGYLLELTPAGMIVAETEV